jgi:hypothetical protein
LRAVTSTLLVVGVSRLIWIETSRSPFLFLISCSSPPSRCSGVLHDPHLHRRLRPAATSLTEPCTTDSAPREEIDAARRPGGGRGEAARRGKHQGEQDK